MDAFIRLLADGDVDGKPAPKPMTASQYLAAYNTQQVCHPAVSSWGDGGAFGVWVNDTNDWLQQRLADVGARRADALQRCQEDSRHRVVGRALRQATREVLLAQSSD